MNYLSYGLLLGIGLLLGWWIAPEPHVPPQVDAARPAEAPGPAAHPLTSGWAGAGPVTGLPAPSAGADVMGERLQAFESELQRLRERVDELEQRLASAPAQAVAPAGASSGAGSSGAGSPTVEVDRSGNGRIQRLTAAGLPAATAEFIDARLQDYELQRLYLRDRAVREGWFGTTRYTEAVNELQGGDRDLRAALDESDYDRYLYATGQPNRLMVAAVMGDSAGAAAGLQANDVIYRYAGERVFNTGELRELTAAGNAGESVTVEVLRGQDLLLFYLPRGPIGVRLNLDRVQP